MRYIPSDHEYKILLYTCGVNKFKSTNKAFRFPSPFRDNKKRSMALYKDKGLIKDFGTGETLSIYTFVKELTGKTVKDILGINKEKLLPPPIAEPKKKPESLLEINAILRDIHDSADVMNYCVSRGMGETFLNNFNIHNYIKQGSIGSIIYTNRLIIPITEDNKVISYELRDFTRQQKKKALYPTGGSVSTLFNIDKLDRSKPLYVVEGIMDTIKIYEHIDPNVTCTFGISITKKQEELLKKFDVILIPDDDDGGNKFIDNLNKFMPKDFLVAKVVGKDPNDATIEELKKAIANAKSSTEILIDNYGIFTNDISMY